MFFVLFTRLPNCTMCVCGHGWQKKNKTRKFTTYYTPRFLKSFTLYILTNQCSVVYASSRTSNSKSLLPISAARTRSYPGGLPPSVYTCTCTLLTVNMKCFDKNTDVDRITYLSEAIIAHFVH